MNESTKGLEEKTWGRTFTRTLANLIDPIPIIGERRMYEDMKESLGEPTLAFTVTICARAYTYIAWGLVAYRMYDAFK